MSMNSVMCKMGVYFNEPDEFHPERWLRDEARSDPKHPFGGYILIPFGVGARNCIGKRYAEQELYIGIVKVLVL